MNAGAPIAVLIGGVGSIGLMRRARQFDGSVFVLFAIWVCSPFVVLGFVNLVSKRWSTPSRATLHAVILILSVVSLLIYGIVALTPPTSRSPVTFLGVPLASWFLISIVIPIAAVTSGTLYQMRKTRWLLKSIATISILILVGIGGLLGSLWWDHNRQTLLPTPTGPFAVGRTTYVWSDPVHSDSMAPQPGAKRELFVWIWYPAVRAQPSPTVADYFPWRTTIGGQDHGIMAFLTRELSRVKTHSIPDADVSPEQGSYPVVFMRAGAAALTTDYTSLAEDLASHGYVVVGFDAPYRSGVVVFPDGRVIRRAPKNNIDAFSGSEVEQLANKLVEAWSADMSYALDQLERLNTSDPSGRFLGRLDMQRVGVFGHSLGGATALQFCHDDSRCKAGIDVDGIPWGTAVQDGVKQPIMFLVSDHSGDTQNPEDKQIEFNFQSIFDRVPSDRRLQVTIRGANHYMFSDDGAMLKSPLLMQGLRMLGIVGINGRRQVAVTEHYISTFFDVYLKGASSTELNRRQDYPEVEYTGAGNK